MHSTTNLVPAVVHNLNEVYLFMYGQLQTSDFLS